jgi:hypothetical protein
MNWYDDHANLAALARHMLDQGDSENIPYMLEKPWKYQDEWRAAAVLDSTALILEAVPTSPPCPSCDRDLSYPGQPGHTCYRERRRLDA